eukprot:1194259-Prorocentrum_minimum.AAC.5
MIYLVGEDVSLNAQAVATSIDVATNNTAGTSAKSAPSFVAGFPGVSTVGQTYLIVDLKV